MADTNSFNFFAVIGDPEVRKAVREVLDDYTGTFVHTDNQTENTLAFCANDVSQGSVEDCFTEILELIRDGVEEFECSVCKGNGKVPNNPDEDCLRCAGAGYYSLTVPDFAFSINDEPQDEFLGTLRIHAPGMQDFESNCDGDGAVVVPSATLIPLINEATSLDTLQADVALLTGQWHLEYLKAASN